jgi:peptidoglycan LD-endopeptidase CwlK
MIPRYQESSHEERGRENHKKRKMRGCAARGNSRHSLEEKLTTNLVGGEKKELMSMRPFEDDVFFLQRLLKSEGLYEAKIDEDFGPKTDGALREFGARSEELAGTLGQFDIRTERAIQPLHLKAQEAARIFMQKVLDAGIEARFISGTRTYAEQNQPYRKGRFGNPPPIVTKPRGGQSNHEFGIARDIGVFENGRYLEESPLYEKTAQVGLSSDLEWGGNWTGFMDRPHFQLVTGLSIAVVRERFENGESYV